MADFEVKVRNLETGEMLVAGMPDAETAIAWLKERPQNLEIVSLISECSPADSQRLKDAMRPYDEAEMKLKAEYDQKATKAAMEQYAKEMQEMQELQAAAADGDEDLDPNRPMSVRYEVDGGFSVVDDTRPLSDAAKAACLAWVEERNAWVKDKGQIVGEAHLDVWPGDVPEGDEGKRVLEGGRFFPLLAN